MKKLFSMMAAAICILAGAPAAQAAVVDVSFTTTGVAGDWIYDFTLANNLGGTNELYFFGVVAPATDVVASPGIWAESPGNTPWTNTIYGGSNIAYNNVWCTYGCSNALDGITTGQSLSGFKVHDTSTTAQTSFAWFAYAVNGNYTGPGCFNCGGNPAFEGVTGQGGPGPGVPEPATWAMMIIGFGAAGSMIRRRRTAIA
jgi:hypothetical protein